MLTCAASFSALGAAAASSSMTAPLSVVEVSSQRQPSPASDGAPPETKLFRFRISGNDTLGARQG